MIARFAAVGISLVVAACAASSDPMEDYEEITPSRSLLTPAPLARNLSDEQLALAQHGAYLVELLGCAACHTDGALVGEPSRARALAGSATGIAFSNPLDEPRPGVVFPRNLTPDKETGLGNWSTDDIAAAIRSGRTRHGGILMPVMPWAGYSRLSEDDATAIAIYLQSLAPVSHRIPTRVAPGAGTDAPYVYFGIYRSRSD